MKRVWPRVLVLLASSCLAVLVAEGAVRVLGLFDSARAATEQSVSQIEAAEEPKRFGKLIHPYRGWMARPGGHASFLTKSKAFFPDSSYSQWALANGTRNELGYLSQVEDYRRVPSEHFVIGIFGGSVASQLAVMGGDAIERGLGESRPDLDGKVVILNCASGAYKQPQQLFALEELLLLGVKFDVIVNVDGVNEVVFGRKDARDGYHPILPSRSQYQSLLDVNSLDPTIDTIIAMAEIDRHRQAIDRLRADARESIILRQSELLRAFVGVLIQRHERAAIELEADLNSRSVDRRQHSVAEIMSDPCLGSEGGCGELVESIWERSSRLMAASALQAGASYLHVLQPNQYVEGSKRLTPVEIEVAYDERSVFAREVQWGFPRLRQRGREMIEDGIAFHDLTYLFANDDEDIFVDSCCHLNHRGYQILGHAIADLISDDVATSQSADSR